jgi:tRNA dimethylallyltransferase
MLSTKSIKNKLLIIIAGPTAVGKSAIAMTLAETLGCSIFSADSRQIYKRMDIGTAKPSIADMQRVRHFFVDHVDLNQHYTVGNYEEEISVALERYFEENDVAVVVGGTGLYINALVQGIDVFPDTPEDVRDQIQHLYDNNGLFYIQDLLKQKDPQYYDQVDLMNSRRITRALEVCFHTGQPYSNFLGKKGKKSKPYDEIHVLLNMDRQLLYDRIGSRVDAMVAAGLVEEAYSLFEFRSAKALETVGYRELFMHFDGDIGLTNAIELVKQNTRRYAKRQMAWFRKFGDWEFFEHDEIEKILQRVKGANR